MATNLNIDTELLDEAKQIGEFKSKRETVNSALAEFVQHHKQQAILKFEGTIDFFEDYDHKAMRLKRA